MSEFEENALATMTGAAAAGVQAAIYVAAKAEGELHPAVERIVGVGVPLALWSAVAWLRGWPLGKSISRLWVMFGLCGAGYGVLLAWRNSRYPLRGESEE